MSESPLVSVFKTVDNIKSAIELGQSDMVIADSAKLIAQVSAAIAVEGYLRTYSALDGFGRALGLWRLGQGINGAGIGKAEALSAFVASELVGLLIDKARELNIGGWIFDLLNPPVSRQELQDYMDDASWLQDNENGSEFYANASNYKYVDFRDPDAEAGIRLNSMARKIVKWKITVTDFDGITQKVYQGVASPIVIDIGGDGIKTTNSWLHSVNFDITGDGNGDRTAWLDGSDAFLAVDKNKNGKIDGVDELFGGLSAGEGFAKLREFDSNGDGRVDGADDRFSELLMWQDKNTDGVSDEGEISIASVSGLDSINTNFISQNVYDNKNLLGDLSSAVWQGKAVDAIDVYFRYTSKADLSNSEVFDVEKNSPLGQAAPLLDESILSAEIPKQTLALEETSYAGDPALNISRRFHGFKGLSGGDNDKVLELQAQNLVNEMAQFNSSSAATADPHMRVLPSWNDCLFAYPSYKS